jgi:peptidoglycan/LPS O-acetylase OafA/YrhL
LNHQSTFRHDIQSIRGLAVISVILFHANPDFFKSGYLGVDVFFVVSGYVVAPLLIRIAKPEINEQMTMKKRVLNFYVKRIYRLLPALGVTLTVSLFLFLLLIKPSDLTRVAQQGTASLLSAGNFGALKFNTNYFQSEPNPFLHTWSLSVEEQIYLFIPILLLVYKQISGLRTNENRFFVFLTTVSFTGTLLVTLNSAWFVQLGITDLNSITFYSPITRFWEFGVGAIAFCNYQKFCMWANERKKKLTNRSLFVILTFLLLQPFHLRTGLLTELITCLLTVLLILTGGLKLGSPVKKTLLMWAGDRSYSLYLIHMPVIHIAKYSPVYETFYSSRIRVLIAVLITFALSIILYDKVENRFRKTTDAKIETRGVIHLLAIFMVIPILVFCLVFFGTKSNLFGLDRNPKQPTYAGDLDESCNRDSEDGDPCVYSVVESKQSLLLVGDSHAFHLSQALIDAANAQGSSVVIWKNMACINSLADSQSPVCKNRLNNLMRYIGENRIGLVLFSFYIKDTSDSQSVRRMILDVSDNVQNIIIIGQTPVFPDENRFFVSRPIIMEPYNAPTKFPVSEMNLDSVSAGINFENWAASLGFEVLETRSTFCDEQFCIRYENDQWLFRDDDHLSVDGAKKLIPLFREALVNTQ